MIKFSIQGRREVFFDIPFTEEQFVKCINENKPKEIFNSQWSYTIPFIVITEYTEDGFYFYCNGLTNKTPRCETASNLYSFLKYQGLESCYINEK